MLNSPVEIVARSRNDCAHGGIKHEINCRGNEVEGYGTAQHHGEATKPHECDQVRHPL